MRITIRNLDAERKLRRLSRLWGKSLPATIIALADQKLQELDGAMDRRRRLRRVRDCVRRVQALPIISGDSVDQILD